MHSYWKSLYLDDLTDDAVEVIASRGTERASPMTLLNLPQLGGAMNRVGDTDTAFTPRDAGFMLSIDGNWFDPAEADENIAWVRSFWDEMQPFAKGGPYLNFLGEDENRDALVKAAYGPNYGRLREIKRRYDPDNVLRLNSNIAP